MLSGLIVYRYVRVCDIYILYIYDDKYTGSQYNMVRSGQDVLVRYGMVGMVGMVEAVSEVFQLINRVTK